MRRLGELLFLGFVFCLLLVASCSAALFESSLVEGFSVNLQSPGYGTTTVDNIPNFKFTVIHPSQLTVNCSLWLENATFKGVYAAQNMTANGSLTTLAPSLPIPNGIWQWWINCSDGANSIISEIWTITVNVFRGDRNFSASYDGSTRYYWLDLPDDYDSSVPAPLVIVLPGYGEDRNSYQTNFPVLRQIFQQNGWMVVCAECRTVDGYYSWYTAPTRSDITDIINLLEQDFNINSSHIHVMGESMGASGTLKYAMFNSDIVASVCAIYGVSNFTEFYSWTQDLTLYNSILTAYGGTPSQVPFIYNDESPLGNEIRFMHTPVFLLHGSADTLVPVSNSRNLNKSLSQAGYDVKYIEVPEAGHDSTTFVGREQMIYEWFRDHPLSLIPSSTPTPMPTLTPTPTLAPTATPTPTPTATPSPAPTNTPAPTPTPTPSLTTTPQPTLTPPLTPIPTPTPTLTPTSSPSPAPTTTPAITYTPTPTATPRPTTSTTPSPTATPIPLITIVTAAKDNGATVDLTINGNISSLQMSNTVIFSNLSASTTTLSFTIKGESGKEGFGNLTIPKNAVSYGASPIVHIDGQRAQTQGNVQDANNYYVWYATRFSTHEVSIVFSTTPNNTYSPSQFQGLPQEVTHVALIAVAIVAIVAVAFVIKRVRKSKIYEKVTT